MKAVILCAGRGKRMMPLTKKTPKPLLTVNGKPIIDYILESLPYWTDEIIIVVKYKGEQIKKHVGSEFQGTKVRYVTGSKSGNAYSFLKTRRFLKNERFLVIYGDEIPNMWNVIKCAIKIFSVLTFKSKGRQVMDGVMVLDTDIFNYTPLPDDNFSALVEAFMRDHKVSRVRATKFIGRINTPKDIKRVERLLNA
jgi:NDP-sugar pyrophosphorylase family protein